jgi:SpoVK/Ycf46/Vps4 family AAA+-type ATPase
VVRLVEYLGWPCFSIDASSIGSPYIHETSRKVAEVFDQAMKSAPSVLVIDEMEAFLADRERGADTSHHRVEEVAEFLRRIPEAVKARVLIIAMTNRIDMIDAAIQRRGRFDHVIHVGMPSQQEVAALLDQLVQGLPVTGDLGLATLSSRLAGRPLSDAAFVVREGARLAARAGKDALDAASLEEALKQAPARSGEPERRKIGFV